MATIPNLISVFRFLLVPAVVLAMLQARWNWALAGFVLAGVSDGIDGFIARHFNQRSELGAYLDPMADKVLLVSVFVVLGIIGQLPLWLVVAAVSRDALIICAVLLSKVMVHPVAMKPLMVSKLNTFAQVAFAALVLAALGFGFKSSPFDVILMGAVAILTLLSVSFYLVEWVRHMSPIEQG